MKEEILEGNKLVALFMGATEMSSTTSANGVKDIHSIMLDGKHYRDYMMHLELKYHSSFDWLIPVVEKIYTLNDYRHTTVYYELTHCYITTPIEIVYRFVIKFITWYNQNK